MVFSGIMIHGGYLIIFNATGVYFKIQFGVLQNGIK
jgi:hypothetical protein